MIFPPSQRDKGGRRFLHELLGVAGQEVEDEHPGAGGGLEDVAPHDVVSFVDQIFPRSDPVQVVLGFLVQTLTVTGGPHHLPPLPHGGLKDLLLRHLRHLQDQTGPLSLVESFPSDVCASNLLP